MAQLGDILAELREDCGFTQKDLSELLHVSISSISAYESGKRLPSIDVLIAYAKQFDVSTDYILRLSDNRESLSVFTEEFHNGRMIGDVITDLKRLQPEQREALLVALDSMTFFADIKGKTTMNGGHKR